MQLQSDYSQCVVDRPTQIETTAMGAAYLAGLGIGHWKNTNQIKKIWKKQKSFKPKQKLKSVLKRKKSWLRAINKACL
jgi:glycerol kinase